MSDDEKLRAQEMAFASQVRKLRIEAGLSQAALVDNIRSAGLDWFNQAALSRLENGTRSPRLIEAVTIAAALRKPLAQMMDPTNFHASLYVAEESLKAARDAWVAIGHAADSLASVKAEAGFLIETLTTAREAATFLDPHLDQYAEALVTQARKLSETDLPEVARRMVLDAERDASAESGDPSDG